MSTVMFSSQDSEWLDARIKERADRRNKERLTARNPNLRVLDASKFVVPLSSLAVTMTHKVEREGPRLHGQATVPLDTAVILRQLTQTYNLLRFVNADDTRFDNSSYQQAYSFVTLPLVRTMIDGFYNCTALLVEPSRDRAFRISGYYRMREALQADESRYSHDPTWKEYLVEARAKFDEGMRVEQLSNADLDNRANKWPVLSEYLRMKPATPHKEMLRKLTLGFWKEYSSISHTSFDGLISIHHFIARDTLPRDRLVQVDDAAERLIAMHLGRASGILLCLLTDIQHFYNFGDADIDVRLGEIWGALIPMVEVRELYDHRYKSLLKKPPIETSTP